jgi:hypothetical protein
MIAERLGRRKIRYSGDAMVLAAWDPLLILLRELENRRNAESPAEDPTQEVGGTHWQAASLSARSKRDKADPSREPRANEVERMEKIRAAGLACGDKTLAEQESMWSLNDASCSSPPLLLSSTPPVLVAVVRSVSFKLTARSPYIEAAGTKVKILFCRFFRSEASLPVA